MRSSLLAPIQFAKSSLIISSVAYIRPYASRSGERKTDSNQRLTLPLLSIRNEQALKIVDALHTGRGHAPPGSVKRACQINCPATGLNEHGRKAEPARVHGRVIDAKISSQPDQEDSLQAALSQVTSQTGGRSPIVLIECRIGIDFAAESFADHQFRSLGFQLRMKGSPRRTLDTMIGPKGLFSIWHANDIEWSRARVRCSKGAMV